MNDLLESKMPTHLIRNAVLKLHPEDFLVFESAAVRTNADETGPYQYLRLRKRGYTTFDAVAAVATFAGLDRQSVTYAGLKDEDAITDQLICVLLPDNEYPVESFNEAHSNQGGAYVRLVPQGRCDETLEVGRLDGNSFRIVVRDLSEDITAALAGRRHNHLFINYYDTQRFGVPGGPRVTHLIGAQLLDGDYGAALQLVALSGATEAEAARSWAGAPDQFFAAMDARLRSFYMSAQASDHWNQDVATLLDCGSAETLMVERDGISYKFATNRDTLAVVARRWPEIEYRKYRSNRDSRIEQTTSTRPTIVQTQISAGHSEPDEAHPGQYKCEVSMFLPSGSYATTALAQLLALTARAGCAND